MRKCDKCKLNKKSVVNNGKFNLCSECERVLAIEQLLSTSDRVDAKMPSPSQIKSILDKYVIKQDDAKIMLAIEAYNHLKRIQIKELAESEKNNILLIGPSGCGKTYLVNTLAEIIDLPVVSCSATEFTATGYVGKSVSSIANWLIDKADGDIDLAEKGIVFIDEIDKIASPGKTMLSHSKDVTGYEVQKELLKMIEGTEIQLTSEGKGMDFLEYEGEIFDTKNLLFIFSGAFEELDNVYKNSVKSIKFGSKVDDNVSKATQISEDLIEYGFLREFIGRIPIVSRLEKLELQDLISIMNVSENNILTKYKRLFAYEDIELDFDSEAIEYIASLALKQKTGARGIKSILGVVMNRILYDALLSKKDKIVIKESIIKEYLSISNKKLLNNS